MFDIGFWELMLIGVMGLVVLGPERLPIAIRTIRGWITGARKFTDTMKSELSEELRVHELHANLKKAEQGNMADMSPEVAESVKSLQEAAAMVNEPFKKIDTSALDEMISTSLANSKSNKDASLAVDDIESDNALNNDKSAYSQTSDTSTIDDKTKDK
ncbi:Sec-independent protein translocase protein TatB [Colwellia sp. E150_009]